MEAVEAAVTEMVERMGGFGNMTVNSRIDRGPTSRCCDTGKGSGCQHPSSSRIWLDLGSEDFVRLKDALSPIEEHSHSRGRVCWVLAVAVAEMEEMAEMEEVVDMMGVEGGGTGSLLSRSKRSTSLGTFDIDLTNPDCIDHS